MSTSHHIQGLLAQQHIEQIRDEVRRARLAASTQRARPHDRPAGPTGLSRARRLVTALRRRARVA